jgi:hypothetical protein
MGTLLAHIKAKPIFIIVAKQFSSDEWKTARNVPISETEIGRKTD